MLAAYTALVTALKALTQGEGTDARKLLMAEDGWNTRPDADSYGIVQLDFEADALRGDNRKCDIGWEGSVDLFSRKRDGDGWVAEITETLAGHCDGAWSLNSHQHERETGLFHWEWTFQVED